MNNIIYDLYDIKIYIIINNLPKISTLHPTYKI
jgi:hypothetical protein